MLPAINKVWSQIKFFPCIVMKIDRIQQAYQLMGCGIEFQDDDGIIVHVPDDPETRRMVVLGVVM